MSEACTGSSKRLTSSRREAEGPAKKCVSCLRLFGAVDMEGCGLRGLTFEMSGRRRQGA
jgi:hypothetical protein